MYFIQIATISKRTYKIAVRYMSTVTSHCTQVSENIDRTEQIKMKLNKPYTYDELLFIVGLAKAPEARFEEVPNIGILRVPEAGFARVPEAGFARAPEMK